MAARLGKLLKGGEVIELVSDLGGGKTAFVQGLAAAMGYVGEVTSPTFTISHIYHLPSELELHHYDLYRLAAGGVVGEELGDDLADDKAITIIEWPGIVEFELPEDRLRIEFLVSGENERQLTFRSGGAVSDVLIKELSE